MPLPALDGPLRFEPLFRERVWGGRRLAELYGKQLPDDAPIGESWEIVDRPEAQSVVAGGPLAGRTLGELWRDHRIELFGEDSPGWGSRFPLLVKLLDAEDLLSVQVHPPATAARELGGEPKTEAWYVAEARPGAHVLAGLRRGVTRAAFERALRAGEDLTGALHRVGVQRGDAMLIPSGRVHAIGPGSVIVEVQQNSDTTYRVFDHNRPGLDGAPRRLHVDEALASIDFDDVEPALAAGAKTDGILVECERFALAHETLTAPARAAPRGATAIVALLDGAARCGAAELRPGDFALVPVALAGLQLEPVGGPAELLRVTLPAR